MGEWKAPPILKAEFKLGMISCDLDAKAVQKLVMTNKELQDHGYPMHGTLALQNIQELALDTTDGEELKACERCGEKFRLGAIADSQECNYHPIRPRQRLVEGAKERFYPCCNKTINLPGCTLWHHVFKEESIAKLHESCQFTTLPPVESNSFKQELIALDCEMVYTTVGFELGRITVVDYSGALLFDTLCKPENPVIDYNTRFSGITDFDSEPTMSLGQVKDALAKLADQSTIIIGHGLENDLLVLRVFMFNRQLIHENVIDTVQVYPHPQGLPFRNSLARLMQQELKRTIQADASGHDSLQDAKSCIELLVHYLARPSKR